MVSFLPGGGLNNLPQPFKFGDSGFSSSGQSPNRADDILARAYERLQGALGLDKTQPLPSERQSAERTAGNILGFIDAQLARDKADGATSEQLQSRLEAGLEGFKEGFEEARSQLDSMGLLTPQIAGEIGETYDRVMQGFDQMRQEYLGESQTAQPVASTQVSALSANVSAAQKNSFDFQLTTLDGDKVSISASSLSALSAAMSADNDGLAGFSASSYQSSAFSLSVSGELDKDELEAIGSLLDKVADLSEDFYGGDLQSAFNKATELGLDDSEIAGYSLNLTQVQVQQAQVAYQSNSSDQANDMLNLLKPVGDFAQSLLDALDEARSFAEPEQLLTDISRGLDAAGLGVPDDDKARGLGDFVERLLGVL